MNGYNPQLYNYDKQIQEERNKIAELERQRMQAQFSQPTILNQTIQAGMQPTGIRYAESIDDVNKELVFLDTLFVNKDFTNLWMKNPQGKVKTYLLEEFIPKDEKDIKIEMLENEIKKLKEEKNNDEQSNTGDNTATKGSVSSKVSKTRGNEEE